MPVALVTGANRGIGLAFVRELLARGYEVHAFHRKSVGGLAELACPTLSLHCVDVSDNLAVEQAMETIPSHIDLLINNAAVYDGHVGRMLNTTGEELMQMLSVNAVGPFRTVKAAWSLLSRAERPIVAMISTGMASITDRPGSNAPGYRVSKSALNMVGQLLRHDLQTIGGSAVLLCPGWVATDMGGPGASLTPQQSVRGMLARIDEQHNELSGRFVGYDGSPRPW